MRVAIGTLLLTAALAACDGAPQADREKAAAPQPARAGAIDRSQAGSEAPAAAFVDRAGKKLRIADFRGRRVVVNLWATWCAPCLTEMPALDRLAAREKERLAVVAVSQDLQGWPAVDKFFTPGRFAALTPYLDQPNELLFAYKAGGLPLSIVYDERGRELWRIAGPLEWDTPETAKLLGL
jgi:thiol-disulfide isomerase/thioredoxin